MVQPAVNGLPAASRAADQHAGVLPEHGTSTELAVGGSSVFVAAGVLLAAAVAGKLAGAHLAGRNLELEPGEASLVGWLLQTKVLIMLMFSNVLLDNGIITADPFTALLLLAVASTVVASMRLSPIATINKTN